MGWPGVDVRQRIADCGFSSTSRDIESRASMARALNWKGADVMAVKSAKPSMDTAVKALFWFRFEHDAQSTCADHVSDDAFDA